MLMFITATSLSEARAEVKTFSCNGGTYSVEMPSGTLLKANGCTGSLVLDPTIKTIGYEAFEWSQLTSIVIPDSVTDIREGAFRYSRFKSVILPNSITAIPKHAFEDSQLESIVIPDSVIEIGYSAFNRTTNLKSITLGKSLKTIETFAFNDSGLTRIIFPESLRTIKEYAFQFGKFIYLDIPTSVTVVESKAFYGNKSLTSIFYCGSANPSSFPTAPTCPVDRKSAVASIEAKIAADAKVAQDAAKVAADRAAADKAAADAKAKADRAATQAAQDAKKLTITCVKGKTSKKVTGESPVCPKGFTNSLNKYLTFQAYSKCQLYKKDSSLAGVSLLDKGTTLKFSYAGKYSSFMASAASYADVSCALSVMKAPSFVVSQIDTTRALDGLQRATWGKLSAFWTYHPDSGVNISFNSK
jgi:hypothetical protein